MACRRRRRLDSSGRHAPNNIDHLAFKYMEMCKVESSTDSESEVSPRWSDTSTMGCASSAAQSRRVPRTNPLMPKSAGRHDCYSMFLDPYDGSSEDSDAFMDVQCHRRTRAGPKSTGCWCTTRNRRHHHPAPDLLKTVTMETLKSTASHGSHSDLDTVLCFSDQEDAMHLPTFTDVKKDSALHGGGPGLMSGWSHMRMDTSSERSASPSNLHKRKFGLPSGTELQELDQRKRQCVLSMEVDSEAELEHANVHS